MKITFIVLFILISYIKSQGQSDSARIFIYEADLSVNRTINQDPNTENKNGYGIGLYVISSEEKNVIIKIGLEYERINLFKQNLYEGHFASLSDITYRISYLSFPLNVQFQSSDETKLFFQIGIFFDFLLSGKLDATGEFSGPFAYNQNGSDVSIVNGDAGIVKGNAGFTLGIGVKIPLSKYVISICPNYKSGFIGQQYYYERANFDRYFRIQIGLQLKH